MSAGDGLWLVTSDVEGILTMELAKPAVPAPEPVPTKGRKDKHK